MELADAGEVVAPDGSVVRPLLRLPGVGSFAHFELAPGQVSHAVTHATVEEIWYVIAGEGRMWRRQGDREEVVRLREGTCLTIPLGTAFQFRAAEAGLRAVAVTAPPWPTGSEDEARIAEGPWEVEGT
ncbi:hypothetical protein A4R43_18215 [Amycolatopsis albispora]|uniref:Cupin type-2 domain-containing protein n=1 Tax=Amycolatopsis albispora TaxID=1804986 RepID=A0A344LKM5_9PSEU|nr:hypothetical protein A4R43_18215 [Amycolatopsis albispora]